MTKLTHKFYEEVENHQKKSMIKKVLLPLYLQDEVNERNT